MSYLDIHFSIIIPLYNKENYIIRTINSILKQKYNFYEIIVVDDGSTDEGFQKLNTIDSNKLVKYQQSNKGVSAARNKGAELANYNYLVFLDADDEWHSNFLIQIIFLIRNFPTCKIFATNNNFVLNDGSIYFNKYENLFNDNSCGIIDNYFELFLKYGISPFSNSNFCIKKDLFFLLGGYKEGVKLTEDSDLWCRAALNATIAYCKLPLSNYYVQIPNNTNNFYVENNYEVTLTLLSLLKSKSIPINQVSSVKRLIAHFQLNLVKKILLNNGKKLLVLKLLFRSSIFKYYPVKYFFYLFLCLLPNFLLIKGYEKFKFIEKK